MCKKVSQRAARKAAAACLARQRHKTFVNQLHDHAEALKGRITLMKSRRKDMFSAVAVHMLEQMGERLSQEQMLQLNRWLMRSPRLAASLGAVAAKSVETKAEPETPAADGSSQAEEELVLEVALECVPSSPSSTVEVPSSAPIAEAGCSAVALDEELCKQAFVAEAMASMQPDGVDTADTVEGCYADDDGPPEHTEWMGPMLHALEMQETYGDGLSALLQHLAASRQPSVQAWMQLKLEAERSNELSSSTWTNLATLEEDFVLMNHEHIHSSSFASWAAPAARSAVH